MEKALESVKDGLTVTAAACLFNLPRQTLKDRISGRFETTKCGRKTALNDDEEQELINYITYMAAIGQPMTIAAIKLFACAISKRGNHQNRFNEKTDPGHNWWFSFSKRHGSKITLRKPDSLDRGRSRMANVNVTKGHFASLKEVLLEHNILDKPKSYF